MGSEGKGWMGGAFVSHNESSRSNPFFPFPKTQTLKNPNQAVYPHKKTFKKPEDQEQYIRDWLAQRAGLVPESQALRIVFYSARYHPELGSIFSVGDVPALIPDEDADALILEEPEHLNWCVHACFFFVSCGLVGLGGGWSCVGHAHDVRRLRFHTPLTPHPTTPHLSTPT